MPRYALAVAPLGVRSLDELSEACRRIDDATITRPVSSLPFSQYVGYQRYGRASNNIHAIEETRADYEVNVEEEDCHEIFGLQQRNVNRKAYRDNQSAEHNLFLKPNPSWTSNPNPCEAPKINPFSVPKPNLVTSAKLNPFSNSTPTLVLRPNLESAREARPSALETRVNVNRVICWNCEMEGHIFRDCREQRSRIFCFVCGRPNYLARNCPKCAGNGERNPSSGRDTWIPRK